LIKFENELENLKKKKLFRSLKKVGEKGVYLFIEGKKCLNLSSNDYLNLSEDERLKRASIIRTHL
jgi:8-amino-7-oxononanoate synthase